MTTERNRRAEIHTARFRGCLGTMAEFTSGVGSGTNSNPIGRSRRVQSLKGTQVANYKRLPYSRQRRWGRLGNHPTSPNQITTRPRISSSPRPRSSSPAKMRFAATLLFLVGNAVFGLAGPAVVKEAADSDLEKRQCGQEFENCLVNSQCCSGLRCIGRGPLVPGICVS
jgi:hypothetical protein